LWPRKLIDISWRDLAFGLMKCVVPARASSLCKAERALVCLSVRSGFDLLLQSLRMPIGSEVIMTAVTIPDMIEIVKRHDLIPIAVDLDVATLSPSVRELKRCLTPRTRAIVIAHLFGAVTPLEEILRFAKEHGLFVIEDAAQAFSAPNYLGCGEADANLVSFGPIKTATALGGALVRVRDERVYAEMRQRQMRYPLQRRRDYAKRLFKYAGLKLASPRAVFGLLVWLAGLVGRDPDRLLRSVTRNFGKRDLLLSIRLQPCAALSAMVLRRWRTYSPKRIERRAELGDMLVQLLEDSWLIPGSRAVEHSHWVLAVMTDQADSLVSELRRNGFDATQRHNLTVLEEPSPEPQRRAHVMVQVLPNLVFLPLYPELSVAAVQRMAQVVTRHESARMAAKCNANMMRVI
jgi:perosamine synthetase